MTDTDIEVENEQGPPQFELERTDTYSQYLLYAKSEILAVLRSLIQKNTMITVHFDQGYSFLLTSMIALGADNSSFILDVGSDEEMNRRALLAKKLIFTALIDRVKVQFSLDKIVATQYGGRQNFLGKIPDKLLRLQRREYFRLSTPIASPLKLRAALTRPDGSALQIEFPLVDISGGGIGLTVSLNQAQLFEKGNILNDCKLMLPNEGLLIASLCVRNLFNVTTRSGAHYVRVGCEFTDLPQARLTLVQRYITRVERERKARLNGMV